MLNVVGQRFGLLTVLHDLPFHPGIKRKVECRCDCGRITNAAPSALSVGRIRSCGCLINRPAHNRVPMVIGERFGSLTILRELSTKHDVRQFECRCDCGQITTAPIGHLQTGHKQSCGCKRKQAATERGRQVLRGDKFGMLTIIRETERGNWKERRFVCACECGQTTIAALKDMVTEQKRSCGCLKHKIGALNLKHGLKGAKVQHPLYVVWRSIKTRCFNPRCKAFKNYGGRGISIAPEWRDDPEAFVAWCLAHGWTPQLTINRLNPDLWYEPRNIEFISKSDNSKQRNIGLWCRKQHAYILAALSLPA